MNRAKRCYLTAVFLLIFHSTAYAGSRIDMQKIAKIESSGNPLAIGKGGDIGLYQITPVLLKDYNNFHSIKYSRLQLFNATINTQIAQWYFEIRIPQLLRHFKIPVTQRNILICYNSGINTLVKNKKLPEITRKYLIKYNNL
jgi:soluble lytic murein transglycosylase-like protein